MNFDSIRCMKFSYSSRVLTRGLLAIFYLAVAAPHAGASLILIANEKATTGTSITELNTTNNSLSTYFTGLSNTDGLAYGTDGFLYATSFNGGTLNRITSSSAFTQIASGFNGSGALAVDTGGSFYVPDFGVPSGGGTTLSKVSPNGGGGYTNTLAFSSGLSTPDGVAFDSHGVLYEADFGSGKINKIDTTSGAVTTWIAAAAGLNKPSALVFDSSDNLYVANFSTGATGTGSISMITSAGVVTNNYVTGLSSPLGLLLDQSTNTFYATSWNGNTVSSFSNSLNATPSVIVSSGLNGPTHLILLQTPEPSRMLLICGGLMGLTLARRRA